MPSLLAWSPEEDEQLRTLVEEHGPKKWSLIASLLKTKSSKQCRRRWKNHLDMDSKATTWTPAEDNLLVKYHRELGNKWTQISKQFGDRTDNAVKNRWHALCRKQPELAEEESPLTTVGVRRGTRTRQLADDFSSDMSEEPPVRKRRRGGGGASARGSVDTSEPNASSKGGTSLTGTQQHLPSVEQMRQGLMFNPLGMLLPGGIPSLNGALPTLPTPFDRSHSDKTQMEGILQQLLPSHHPLNPRGGGSPYEIEVAEIPPSGEGVPTLGGLPFDGSAALQEWLAAGLGLAQGDISLQNSDLGAALSQSVSINELLQWLNSNTAGTNLSTELFPTIGSGEAHGPEAPAQTKEGHANTTNNNNNNNNARSGGPTRRSHRTLTDTETSLQNSLSSSSGLSSGQRDLLIRLFSQVRDSMEVNTDGGGAGGAGGQQQQGLHALSELPPLDPADAAELQKMLSFGLARSLSMGFANGMGSLLAATGSRGDVPGGVGVPLPGGQKVDGSGSGSNPISGDKGKIAGGATGGNKKDGGSVAGKGRSGGGRPGSRARKGTGGGGEREGTGGGAGEEQALTPEEVDTIIQAFSMQRK